MNPQAVEIMREALEKISSIHRPTSDPTDKYDLDAREVVASISVARLVKFLGGKMGLTGEPEEDWSRPRKWLSMYLAYGTVGWCGAV